MPSVEELLSIAEFDTDTRSTMDNRIEIDADTRIIQMMPQDELFGVESDEKSERKYFKVPKVVGNGVDLSKLQLRINYQNASRMPSGKDMYIVTDATVYNDEWVYFSWELSRKVTQYKGNIYFVVCAVKADSKGNITNEWNTTLAEGKVLEGLEVEISQEQQYQASDYLEQLKQQLLDYSKEIKETFPSDYTEMSEDVKNLKGNVQKLDDNKITKFYTNNNGDMALNDSDNGKIQDLMIYGKSEQKQYTGKNLLNYEKWKTVSIENGTAVYENNGVTLTAIGDDAYTDYRGEKAKILVTVGKSYILSWESEQIEGSRAFIFPNGMIANSVEVRNEKQVKYTVPVGIDYITFHVGVLKKGQTISFKNIMFEEGSERTDYEPYTGGKPSPSPEYPQEIKAVINPVIKTCGKNLVKASMKTVTKNGITCVNNGDGTYTMNGTATGQIDFYIYGNYDNVVRVLLDSRKTYIVKKSGNSNVQHIVGIADIYKVTAGIGDTQINNQAGISFFICRILSGATLNNFTIYPQVEEGSVSTDFKPYQESQATLPYELNAIPVSSGGNVTIDGQQYIADYVDVKRGKLVRKTHVTKFTGAEHWLYTDSDKESSKRFGTSIQVKGVPYLGLSNYVINANKVIINRENAFSLYGTWVDVRITKFTSLAEFKNFLSEINSSGKPMIVIYALVTPEEIDLTPEAIEAFKALSTYYPKTYVDAESEQLEAYTMFNYPVSMEKGWEYVKQQIGDTRKYVYDMDTKLTETEASTLEAKIDTAILSEMVGG